jgi:hypothetical protein
MDCCLAPLLLITALCNVVEALLSIGSRRDYYD